MWRPDNWEEIVGKLESPRDEVFSDPGQNYDYGFYHGIEIGADTILKEALTALEKEIRAHTSVVCAEAIIGGELWKQMLN